MSTIEIHHCPRCDLRFTNLSEVEDHLYRDHDVVLSKEAGALFGDPTSPSPSGGRIAVPLDPTRSPPKAAQVAMAIARQASMSVELIAAQPPGLDPVATDTYLHRRMREVADAHLSVTCSDLGPARPADAILEHLGRGGVSLVCMDTQTRGAVGEMAFGSVSLAVTRRSPVPLLLCGLHAEPATTYDRIVVGIDGSELAEGALLAAVDLSRAIGARVELVEVVESQVALPADVSETGHLARLAASCPVPIDRYDAVHDRHPGRALAEAASGSGAILAVGTQGRTGFRRLHVGSVAIDAVRHATGPVLVVPPTIQVAQD